jgi:XTP/dITP diphosphohydrolase
MEILLGTRNQGKIREFESLFAKLSIKCLSLNDFILDDVEETGLTFEENAILKAKSYAMQSKMIAIADDSGLEVANLDNRPGVLSARYAGLEATDNENIAKIIDEMKTFGDEQRAARFICVIAVSDEKGKILKLSRGECFGKIAYTPTGLNGFGYDSIFIPEFHNQSFGVLSSSQKEQISHRKRAFENLRQYFVSMT